MRSNLNRLTGPDSPAALHEPLQSPWAPSEPAPSEPALSEPAPSEPARVDPAPPDWLGSAQWLHGNQQAETDPAVRDGLDDGYRPQWADDDPGPEGPLKRRWRSTPAAAIALIAVGLCATAIALYTVIASGDTGPQVPVNFPATAGVAAPSASTSTSAGAMPPESVDPPTELVVSVVGLVHRPGLVRLTPQSRVADAISRAGGAKNGADLLSLNMAQPLRDGDQILVGFADPAGGVQMRSAVVPVDGAGGAGATPGASVSSGPVPAGTDPAGPGLINLNTATEAELDTLPGVGPVTAAAIIGWRQANGNFASVDQLAEVDGIGPGRLEKLRGKVTV